MTIKIKLKIKETEYIPVTVIKERIVTDTSLEEAIRNYGQKKLADFMGVTRSSIGSIVNGRRTISQEKYKQLKEVIEQTTKPTAGSEGVE